MLAAWGNLGWNEPAVLLAAVHTITPPLLNHYAKLGSNDELLTRVLLDGFPCTQVRASHCMPPVLPGDRHEQG